MTYLVNKSRATTLLIEGVDYSANLIEWTVSDASLYKQGCMQTSGSLKLGTVPGGTTIADYDRNKFRRGDEVQLYITKTDGASVLHPRGRLYVISVTYDVESESLDIEIGCRLVLIKLTESSPDSQLDTLLNLIIPQIYLDPAQRSYENCCGGFATLGKYIYQDNAGDLVEGTFWDGDDYESTAAGLWVSVLGLTAEAVQPLAAGEAIPDEILLKYDKPDQLDTTDNRGRVDDTITESYYFLSYPVVNWVRQNSDADEENPNGTLANVKVNNTTPTVPGISSSCGNTPSRPGSTNVTEIDIQEPERDAACDEGYETVQSPIFLPAKKIETSLSKYDGPGGQLSYSKTVTQGPLVEANQQFFADEFAYCRQTWASKCLPNANCPYNGMDIVTLGYTETLTTFGVAGEVVKTVQDTYQTKLAGAQPTDWRSGNNNGKIQDFNPSLGTVSGPSSYYRVQRVETFYTVEDNRNVETAYTYTSITSRGTGVTSGANIDALKGIVTLQIRRSATIAPLTLQPDTVNSPTTSTTQVEVELPLFTGRYKVPPNSSGPYQIEESIPVPILVSDANIAGVIDGYSNYITRWVKGDAFGLQIGEALRDVVVDNWYPGAPFRYYDPSRSSIIAMRMDATTWGVDQEGSAFVTNGVWNGFSNGTITLPVNAEGASGPDMTVGGNSGFGGTGGTPTAPGATNDATINNETNVDSGTFAWVVNIEVTTQYIANTFTVDGVAPPPPDPENVNVYTTPYVSCAGILVFPGDTVGLNGDGSIPAEFDGLAVVDDATVINADLFSDVPNTGANGGGINLVNNPQTELLLHADGASGGSTFTDSSLAARTITLNGTPTTDPSPPRSEYTVPAGFSVWSDQLTASNGFITFSSDTEIGSSDADMHNVNTGLVTCMISQSAKNSGKWYVEFKMLAGATETKNRHGFMPASSTGQPGGADGGVNQFGVGLRNRPDGVLYVENTTVGSIQDIECNVNGDVRMMAIDFDNKLVWFGKNGTWNGDPAAGTGAAVSGWTGTPDWVFAASFAEPLGSTQLTSLYKGKFGPTALALPTANGSIDVPVDAALDITNDNFTIEFWFYPTYSSLSSTLYTENLLSSGGAGEYSTNYKFSIFLRRTSSGAQIKFEYMVDGISYIFYSIGATVSNGVNSDEWNHLAISRLGNALGIWVNGDRIREAELEDSFREIIGLTSPEITIGGPFQVFPNSGNLFEGYIDEVRITTNGVQYNPSSTSITVPTDPFTDPT